MYVCMSIHYILGYLCLVSLLCEHVGVIEGHPSLVWKNTFLNLLAGLCVMAEAKIGSWAVANHLRPHNSF